MRIPQTIQLLCGAKNRPESRSREAQEAAKTDGMAGKRKGREHGHCHRLSAAAVLCALGTLSGCGGSIGAPASVWMREDTAPATVREDEKDCVAQSGQYNFLQGPNIASGPAMSSMTAGIRQQGDIYESCMVDKGYYRGAPQPEGAGGAPANAGTIQGPSTGQQ
jgi:hypothetical protein